MAAAARFRGLALAIISLGALAADQFSKHAVDEYRAVGSLRVVIPGLLNLVHTTNPGVAFGLFADS
jgi:lipoprotein signal peptidase